MYCQVQIPFKTTTAIHFFQIELRLPHQTSLNYNEVLKLVWQTGEKGILKCIVELRILNTKHD